MLRNRLLVTCRNIIKKNQLKPCLAKKVVPYLVNLNQNHEHFSTFSQMKQIHAQSYSPLPTDVSVAKAVLANGSIGLHFSDGVKGNAPFLWLRDNCLCPNCYDQVAMARKLILADIQLDSKPKDFQCVNGILKVTWNDGHESSYDSNWLYYRAFTQVGQKTRDNLLKLDKERWGKELQLDTYTYKSIITDEKICLDWLVTLEKKGVALVQDMPLREDAGSDLIDHVAIVRKTHFGRQSPVKIRPDANNVGYTGVKLSLHSDLPFYDNQPGLIFLHMVKQHEGTGGDSSIADGLHAAEILRKKHPNAFKLLTNTEFTFWDKGLRNIGYEEKDSFYKITAKFAINLGKDGEIQAISHNNAVRDSFINLPWDEVNEFYRALKLFSDILDENAYFCKLKSGEMLTLDNLRCLHGRKSFHSTSERHLEAMYVDWDEMRCRRRSLQEKFAAT